MKFSNERAYIGHMDQLICVKEYTLMGGRQQGAKAIGISNGAGLDITILPDRGMDFYQIRYMGKNVNYIAPCGIVSPGHTKTGDFMDSFFAGFLTTCGMNNIGLPNEDGGERLALHGDLSATPAENVSIDTESVNGVPAVVIRGQMKQASLFGSNLVLKRTICCKYEEDSVEFADEVVNNGYRDEPLMLLYHFNMGYPLLSEHAVLNIPSKKIRTRTAHAEKHVDKWREITAPEFPYEEMCYYHDIERLPDGTAEVGISNPQLNMGLTIRYDRDLLDHFVQWKQLGKGEYAMGLEPCNATIEGRADARKNGSLKFLKPGQKQVYRFKITFSKI